MLVANHSSHLDAISILFGVAAEETASRVSGRRQGLLLREHAADGRGGSDCKRIAVRSANQCAAEPDPLQAIARKSRNVLLLFPEGTRSTTGELGEFKPGIGLLLAGIEVPVVPCFLEVAFQALPKGSVSATPRPCESHVGTPRSYSDLQERQRGRPAY